MAKQAKQPRLTLHNLLGALSFWGTSVRVLLMTFLAGAVLAAQIIVSPDSYGGQTQGFIYVVGSFFLLDAGYVMLARAMPFRKVADMTILLLADIGLALSYVLPSFVHVPGLSWFARWSIISVIFILSIRALIGLLMARPQKR